MGSGREKIEDEDRRNKKTRSREECPYEVMRRFQFSLNEADKVRLRSDSLLTFSLGLRAFRLYEVSVS